MRIFALVTTGIGLVVFSILIIDDLPSAKQWWVYLWYIPLLSSFATLIQLEDTSENWLSLWFKRKALEEKRKISELNQDTQGD